MEIDNKIREYREAQKITQEELAHAAGVSRQTIIAMEKGHYEPSLGLALKLARFFSSNGGSASGGKVRVEDLFMVK